MYCTGIKLRKIRVPFALQSVRATFHTRLRTVRTFVQTIASWALYGELGLGLGLGLDVGVALGVINVKRAYYVIGYIPATSHTSHDHAASL